MKKKRIIMSIILISVLFVLCIVSFTNKQIYSFIGIENLKSDISSLTSDNTTNTKSSSESATRISDSSDDITKNNNPLSNYKTTIPDYKLKSMNELVQISLQDISKANLTFMIKSAKVTKKFPGYTLDPYTLKDFNGAIDEEGNLLEGYYYLDVEIAVTNTGTNTTVFGPDALAYIIIKRETHAALFRSAYYYNGTDCMTSPYYCEETDRKSLIPMSVIQLIMNFEPGETCEYRACYIVPEEYNTDELYLFYSSGTRSIEDANQRFIKLDIQ